MVNLDPEKFYDELGENEWNRKEEKLAYKMEFQNTLEYLEGHLPEIGKVLDAGGGSGRYSVWLMENGYDVTLVDISQEQLRVAREKVEERGLEGRFSSTRQNILDTGFKDESFDSVLCLGGTLSHLIDEEEREKAVKELKRVAKPGSPIFVSVLGFFAAAMDIILDHREDLAALPDFVDSQTLSEELVERNDVDPEFAESYFFRVSGLEELLESAGLEVEKVVGLQNIGSVTESVEIETRDHEIGVRKAVEKLLEDEEAANLSMHIMAVARKPGD